MLRSLLRATIGWLSGEGGSSDAHSWFALHRWSVGSPSGPETLEVIDSTTEEVFATIPRGTPADIDRAVQAAHRAFPGWATTSAKDPAAFLERIVEGLEARADEIADVITHEVGMPLNLTRAPGRTAHQRVRGQCGQGGGCLAGGDRQLARLQ